MCPKNDDSKSAKKPKPKVEKPDEMSDEVIHFIAAIDELKRRKMVQHLELAQVIEVAHDLGYRSATAGRGQGELRAVEQALDSYRREHDRLFPNWSEVWSVLRELGYEKAGR